MTRPASTPWESLIDGLAERRWHVWEGFLGRKQVESLLSEAEALRASGGFRAAGMGRAGDRTVDPSIRGDEIRWWPDDVNDLGPQAAQLRARLDELREAINGSLYLGLKRAEIHFAHYPPGAGYARHVDRPRGSGDRMVSGVLYLNLDWKTADGGELALWPQDGAEARVEPRAGTLVTFLSEDLPHQVMPAHRDRWSVTFWLSRASAPGLI